MSSKRTRKQIHTLRIINNTMKELIILVVVILNSLNAYTQEIDSLVFDRISKKLEDDYLKEILSDRDNLELRNNCIYDREENFTLSCVYTDWDPDWITDFDGDSNQDLVVWLMDEGLGGGGNNFGYSYYIVTLDPNLSIREVYTLFGGGKLSYSLLGIDTIYNGRVYATYEPNKTAYLFADEDSEKLQELNLEFFLDNNMLVEKNYKKCPIAEMNKNIFKDNIEFQVVRNSSLDDQYNREQNERLLLRDSNIYYASIAGCEEIELIFTTTIPYNKTLENDKSKIKSTWMEHISFLKETTRYPSLFNELSQKLVSLKSANLNLGGDGRAEYKVDLKNKWRAYLYVSGNEEQGSFITIRFLRLVDSEPLDFWESLVRKSNL